MNWRLKTSPAKPKSTNCRPNSTKWKLKTNPMKPKSKASFKNSKTSNPKTRSVLQPPNPHTKKFPRFCRVLPRPSATSAPLPPGTALREFRRTFHRSTVSTHLKRLTMKLPTLWAARSNRGYRSQCRRRFLWRRNPRNTTLGCFLSCSPRFRSCKRSFRTSDRRRRWL